MVNVREVDQMRERKLLVCSSIVVVLKLVLFILLFKVLGIGLLALG